MAIPCVCARRTPNMYAPVCFAIALVFHGTANIFVWGLGTMGIYSTIKILFGNGKMNIHSNYNVLKINEFDLLHAFDRDGGRSASKSARSTLDMVRHLFTFHFRSSLSLSIVFLVHGKSIRFTPTAKIKIIIPILSKKATMTSTTTRTMTVTV